MPVRLRRTLLVAICMVMSASATTNAETLVPPLSRMQPPEISARGDTASASAKSASRLAAWWNDLGLSIAINRSLRKHDAETGTLLQNTGQPGVLVYVQIERIDHETPIYYLVGDNVDLVGAGTSKEDVYFAYIQKDRLRAARDGAKSDIERSSFLWFTKSGKEVQVASVPAAFVVYPAAQNLADVKLRETLNMTADGHALDLAVGYLEQTTKDAALKKRIVELRARQAETNQRVAKIESDLQMELDRARKAQSVAFQLQTIATVFNIGQQVASIASYLGDDTFPAIKDAKTPEELKGAVSSMLADSVQRRDALQVQYKSFTDAKSQQRTHHSHGLVLKKGGTL